jgi:hypothetical protein
VPDNPTTPALNPGNGESIARARYAASAAILNRLDNGRIVILGLVDARQDRPHSRQDGREGSYQVAQIGFIAQRPGVVARGLSPQERRLSYQAIVA